LITPASLPEFVEFLRAQQLLLTVSREVDPTFELHAVVRKVQAGPNLPVLFESVRGTRFPVLSNTLGNYEIIARLLGVNVAGLAARWSELTAPGAEPVTLEHAAPPDDLVEISLSELPHIVYCEKDAGPYLTAGVIVGQDPDSEVLNLSYHRMQIVSATELRCRLSTSGDLFRIHQKQEHRGQPLNAVVALGLPPAIMLAAGSTIGQDRSEYDLAARLSGRRFPLRTSPTLGLPIPAATEIVIEGKILAGARRPEGPFGEWMDYYVPVTDNHVFQIDHVFARRGAIFYAISSGSTEEIAISSLPIAGSVFAHVRTWVSSLRDVSCFPLLQICAISIDKQFEGQPRQAILAAFGAEMNRLLYCVVVDADVDIHDWRDVLWAMATRCRPDRDIFQIPNVPSFARDPHQIHWGRLGVDATKPLAHAAEFERKTVPGLRDVRLEDYVR
jgi:UbiD family decarboxylase